MLTMQSRQERIDRAKRHAAENRLQAGSFAGCSVGCDAIDIGWRPGTDNAYALVAAHDGTPEWLEHLRDRIFEGLLIDKRAWWHVALAEALPADVELDPARRLICIAILDRIKTHTDGWDMQAYGNQIVAAIDDIIAYHHEPSDSVQAAARKAIKSAIKSASAEGAESAWSAACSAAWSAATESVESIAEAAAWNSDSILDSTARAAEYEWTAEAVISIMQSMRPERQQ